jgi:hypothetical protein
MRTPRSRELLFVERFVGAVIEKPLLTDLRRLRQQALLTARPPEGEREGAPAPASAA